MEKMEQSIAAEDPNRRTGQYMTAVYPFGRGPMLANNQTSLLILMADAEENDAMSITNNVERVATAAVEILRIGNPGRVMWVEHYPDRAFIRDKPQFKAHYDLVTFEWEKGIARARPGNAGSMKWVAKRPIWNRVSLEWLEQLVRVPVGFSYGVKVD